MDIDFSASARAATAGLTPGECAALERHLCALAAALEVGQQRSAIFDVGVHLVSCTFERAPHQLLVHQLRRLPTRCSAPGEPARHGR